MNFKSSLIAVAAVLAVGAASAADVNKGALTFDEGAAFFGATVAGNFSLYWTFTLDTASVTTGSVTSKVNSGKDVDFSNVFITDGSNTFNFTKLSGDPAEQWVLNAQNLSANVTYKLFAQGIAFAPVGQKASFGGELTVTPVPEPETYALMLAGLGAVGFVARRRKAA